MPTVHVHYAGEGADPGGPGPLELDQDQADLLKALPERVMPLSLLVYNRGGHRYLLHWEHGYDEKNNYQDGYVLCAERVPG